MFKPKEPSAQIDVLRGGIISINKGEQTFRVHPNFQKWILDLHIEHALRGQKYSAFVLSITDRCNIKCDYCCHPYLDSALSEVDSVRMVSEACRLPFSEIAATGGEPFIRRQLIYRLAGICKENRKLFGTITNGFWARRRPRAFDLACDMVTNGIARVTFSWDPSHGEFVDPATIQNGIDACMSAGMRVTLAGSFKDPNDQHENYGIDVSEYTDYANFRVARANVAPAGWGKNLKGFHRDVPSRRERTNFRCPAFAGDELVVYARDGLTQPCCSVHAGYDMPALRIGDWRTETVAQLYDAHRGDGFYRLIADAGFDLLYQVINKRAPEIGRQLPQPEEALSACELCEKLMQSPVARRVREICDEEITDRLLNTFEQNAEKFSLLFPSGLPITADEDM